MKLNNMTITLTVDEYNNLLDMLEELKYKDHSESMRGQEVDEMIDQIKINTK